MRQQFKGPGFWFGSLILCVGLTFMLWHNTTKEPEEFDMLKPVSFNSIANWSIDDHRAALHVFAASCDEITDTGYGFFRHPRFGGKRSDWLAVCQTALGLQARKNLDERAARDFFEHYFTPVQVFDDENPEGLFTGYYEPEVIGSAVETAEYPVPIYARPQDLLRFDAATEHQSGLRYGRMVNGKPQRYFTRREIENGALAGRGLELVWLKNRADAFFIQIQGSARVKLTNGETVRLSYGGKNDLPYTAIGGELIERGDITREAMSMQAIRNWMAKHPAEAGELMWKNESFVFFRKFMVEDLSSGPPGAQQVNLSPLRSLAVDSRIWAYGTPIWLETHIPNNQTPSPLNRLFVAQDTGSAIRGPVRGDVFFGSGADAAQLAGPMKAKGRMIVLLPKALAGRLLQETLADAG